MAFSGSSYCYEEEDFRKKLFSPLKNSGFVPEKNSELFVSGIPETSTLHDLLTFFEKIGPLFQIKLMTKRDRVHNRGFAYISYMNKQLAKRALDELTQELFMGQTCLSMQLSIDNCRIFLSGVPVNKSKDEIWQELKSYCKLKNLVDVITYRNYGNPTYNRGFVFLEFRTHEDASYFRAKYWDKLYLFGQKLTVDWSIPHYEGEGEYCARVKILFVRNLDVTQTSEEFARCVYQLVDRYLVEKVYKFKDYAYIHLVTRVDAERLMEKLKRYYHGSTVEVAFAKPPNKFTDRHFRDRALISRRAGSTKYSHSRHMSLSSSVDFDTCNERPHYTSQTDLYYQLSEQCMEMENALKDLKAQRNAVQNSMAPDLGTTSSSSGQSSNFGSSHMVRPDFRNQHYSNQMSEMGFGRGQGVLVPQVSLQHYPSLMATAMNRVPLSPVSPQDYSPNYFDMEDMVSSLLRDV